MVIKTMGFRITVEINAYSEQEAVDMLQMALEDHDIHFSRISSDHIAIGKVTE